MRKTSTVAFHLISVQTALAKKKKKHQGESILLVQAVLHWDLEQRDALSIFCGNGESLVNVRQLSQIT